MKALWWDLAERRYVCRTKLADGRIRQQTYRHLREVIYWLGPNGILDDELLRTLLKAQDPAREPSRRCTRGERAMSRYTVPYATFGPDGGTAVVGWDPRRGTYFATADDKQVYAIGLTDCEIPTVVDLIRKAYAFTEIDDDTIAALLEDPALAAAGNPPRVGVQSLRSDRGFLAATPQRKRLDQLRPAGLHHEQQPPNASRAAPAVRC